MSSNEPQDVLEQNVSTLLESGGEPPKLSDVARARIRAELVAKHGIAAAPKTKARTPLVAVGIGLAATAATALVITRLVLVGSPPAITGGDPTKLADGSTYIAEPGAKVTVLGPRRVRVEGAALLDVAPGKGTFVVETARGRIEVVGTRFLVDAEAQKTTAAVVRGQVKLATDQGEVLLHAGEQAVAEPGRPPVRGPAPRLSHLASWAQRLRHREEGTIEPIRHGSLFARDPGVRPNGQFGEEYPLPIKQLTLDVVVEEQVARVAMDQTFHNPQNRVLEGVYKFAIPPDAALQRLAMYVDGTLTESAVVERMRARRIYEELVYRRIDPALLEYAGTGRLNLRVYPLPARQDKRLLLAYTQSLPRLYSDWTLAIPLPEVDEPVGELLVSARVKGCANCELTSPSHPITVERSGEDAIVKYRRAGEKIGDAFVVHVRDARRQVRVATRTEGSDRYMLVRAPAELGGRPREYRPRTWVILDDVSASRSAMELKAQADLVDAFLRELDEDDKVAIVAFDVEARLKLAPTRVDDVDRRAVRQLLKDEGGVGATDIAKALETALGALGNTNPDDAMIVYLGDGVITSGPRQLDTLRSQLAGKAHFIGVGIGDGPDIQTLGSLAGATGGFATTIDLSDDLGWRAFDLIAALHTSRVTGVTAKLVDAQGQLVPATAYLRAAQLADGEELELVAKLAGPATPAAVELSGTRNGAPWTQRIAIADDMTGLNLAAPSRSTDAGYLPRMWAQQHIAARLLAKHEPVVVPPCGAVITRDPAGRAGGAATPCPTEAELREKRDEEIRKEIVMLGKQYFLLSRHTSLIVLENDAMYAKYGVRKGGGDTWAPYSMPAKIPVATAPPPAVIPSDVAQDAELVRAPLQVFYDAPGYSTFDRDFDSPFADAFGGFDEEQGTIALGRLGTIGHGSGTGSGFGIGGSRGFGRGGGGSDRTRASLGLANKPAPFASMLGNEAGEAEGDFAGGREARAESAKAAEKSYKPAAPVMGKRASISTTEVGGGLVAGGPMRRHRRVSARGYVNPYGVIAVSPMRFTFPNDQAFDDLTALIPALVPDAADAWREQLIEAGGDAKSFPIDEAAKRLLGDARRKLPAGIYRWAELELAVDDARRIGWRRTSEAGLGETASYDGTSFTRRYAELGLSATRTIGDADLALSLAYLPVWIAEPSHYARYFVVGSRGPREVTLSVKARGKDQLAFVLAFDDSSRLVSIRDGEGAALLEVTWGASGPTAARVGGEDISVGFTATPILDASRWAHQASLPGVTVELPTRLPDYWRTKLAKEPVGTPSWRHVQRQLLASAAALGDRQTLYKVYTELQGNGGVELGDLVLASGGIATATTDTQLAEALAPHDKQPLARYLIAGRAYGKAPKPARMAPETKDGLVGALWSLRSITAQLAGSNGKRATDELLAMGNRAFALRLVGAALVGQRYDVAPADMVRAWDSVATGDYKNVANAQAVQVLYSRGSYDLAAERGVKLVNELELGARPARPDYAQYAFMYSRRGQAGWQLTYARWRDRVVASSSFAHVMAFLPLAAQHPADLPVLLQRALALAGDDVERKLAIAQLASQYSQPAMANAIVEPMLKTSPTRDALQLAANLALAQGRTADALGYLERAQDAGADEAVDLPTVRGELAQIIGLARQLALQSSGTTRDKALARGLEWGARWRMIDPGNAEIDRQLGDMLLAAGDSAGAWRQLSSAIERDPWTGAGYVMVADAFEREGKVAEALDLWQQAIVIDQTNPTHRLRKAQALIALGRTAEGDTLLEQITKGTWHAMWDGTVYQAKNLIDRGKPSPAR